jgi:hypothetical protein
MVLHCPKVEDRRVRVSLGMDLDGNTDTQVAVVVTVAAAANGNKDANVHPDVKVEEIRAKDGNGVLDRRAYSPAHGGSADADAAVKVAIAQECGFW